MLKGNVMSHAKFILILQKGRKNVKLDLKCPLTRSTPFRSFVVRKQPFY